MTQVPVITLDLNLPDYLKFGEQRFYQQFWSGVQTLVWTSKINLGLQQPNIFLKSYRTSSKYLCWSGLQQPIRMKLGENFSVNQLVHSVAKPDWMVLINSADCQGL